MTCIILVTHGELSKAMFNSVSMVMGESSDIFTLSLMPEHSPNQLKHDLENVLISIQRDAGQAIVVTDFPLSTPFNVAIELCDKYKFSHITGMNMPLLFYLINNRESGVEVEQLTKDAACFAGDQLFDVNERFGRG